jgi:hypothetical protein
MCVSSYWVHKALALYHKAYLTWYVHSFFLTSPSSTNCTTQTGLVSSALLSFPTWLVISLIRRVKLLRIRIRSFGRKPIRVGDLSSVFASWSLEQRNQTNSWQILKCSFWLLQKLWFQSVKCRLRNVRRTNPATMNWSLLMPVVLLIIEFVAGLLELQSNRFLELGRSFSLR